MKPNILFLSPVSFFKGGAERSLFDLLANPNITPILIASEEGPILERGRKENIACHTLSFGSIHNIHRPFSFLKGLSAAQDLLKAAKNLKKMAKENNAKIVHSNGLKAHCINVMAYRMGGAKAVLHIRDIAYTKAELLVWRILQRMSYKMVLVSHACWPEETLPKNVHVIHNGTPLINDIPENDSSDIIRFGFIGRIHPAKGLHLVIDWIAKAREQGLLASLSVRGTYSEDAPDYESEIEAQIAKLNLQDHVTFTGFIDNPIDLYKNIDITAVPSKTPDPLPRSVMESMARGIPVFGYPAGGIFEMIDDKETGFLVDNANKFIEAIAYINSNENAMNDMTDKAKVKIENEFSIPNLHQGITALYK